MAPKDMNRILTWEVVPADVDVDFDQATKKVQAITIEDAVKWIGTPTVQPHVFGLSKIVIVCQITKESVTPEMIGEQIEALSTEEVEYSGTVVNVEFIEVDRPKLSAPDQLKEDLKAAKAKVKELTEENNCHCEQIVKLQNALVDARAGKSKAPAKEAAAATGLPDGLNKKLAAKAEQDGAAKSKELKKMNEEYGNKYFAAGITAAEGNPKALERSMIGANNTTHAHNTAALGKVFASEGPESLAVCIYVPEDSEVQAKEWLDAAMEGIGGMAVATDVHETGSMISLKVQQNTEAGRFPIKDKDEVIHHAFTYIRSKGLLNETDDDDEPDISALGEYASKPGHLTGTKLRPSSQD